MLVTLTFAALHINTNLYLCEFADAPTRGRELVFINGTNALVCLKATSLAWMAPICKYVRWASSQTHKSKGLSQNGKILRQVFFSWERGDQV